MFAAIICIAGAVTLASVDAADGAEFSGDGAGRGAATMMGIGGVVAAVAVESGRATAASAPLLFVILSDLSSFAGVMWLSTVASESAVGADDGVASATSTESLGNGCATEAGAVAVGLLPLWILALGRFKPACSSKAICAMAVGAGGAAVSGVDPSSALGALASAGEAEAGAIPAAASRISAKPLDGSPGAAESGRLGGIIICTAEVSDATLATAGLSLSGAHFGLRLVVQAAGHDVD